MKKVLLLLLVIVLAEAGVYAGNKQLELVSSSVENGSEIDTLTPTIELEFSNNVINMKVQESNKAHIVLLNEKEESLPVVIEMADDQISPEMKRLVTVKTEEELESGKSYSLVVQAGFSAKNGSQLNEDVIMTFNTPGGSSYSPVTLITMLVVIGGVGFSLNSKRRKNVQE